MGVCLVGVCLLGVCLLGVCLLGDSAWGCTLQVHNTTSKLATTPASPEDFADLLDFMEKLEQRRHGLDDTYDHVCSLAAI